MKKIIDKMKFKPIKDLCYSSFALIIMNIVLQLIIYPIFSKEMGNHNFGIVITLLSICTVCATTFGSSANYSRIIKNSYKKDFNGDYNIYLFIAFIICILISAVTIYIYCEFKISNVILFSMLLIFTIIRYYADVNYRIELNYKYYFLYYIMISIGYIIGICLYYFFNNWFMVIIIGELFGILFVKIKGNIFKRPYFNKSIEFKNNIKYTYTLAIANFIEAIMSNIDKIVILTFIGAQEVTFYYVATLLGKTASLLTTPLNSVIMSYITKSKEGINKKRYIYIIKISIISIILLTIITTIVSIIILPILYSEVFTQVKAIVLVGNLGQIINFISITMMVIILKFVNEKYQIYINLIHIIMFLAIVIPLSSVYGINGIVYGIIVVNFIKYIIVCLLGIFKLK